MRPEFTIKLKRRTLVLGALVALVGVAFVVYVSIRRDSGSPDVQDTPAARCAQDVVRTMLNVTDSRDASGWQRRLDVLSNDEGRGAWSALLAQGWWRDIESQRLVTEAVTITQAREQDATSPARRTVVVSGTLRARGATGAFERPFTYRLVVALAASGECKFASFDANRKEQ